MSQEEKEDSNYSDSDNEKNEKSQDLVKYSKKNIFLYDKKCRIVLHLGVLYKNLTKAAANSINLDKITTKIQSMIDKNQIYLRDAGPIILGITKIVVKKTNILFEDIEELTKLRINSKEQSKTNIKDEKESIEENDENRTNLVNLNMNGHPILGNDIKESTGTAALNINSLDDDVFNYKNSHLLGLENSIMKNNKINNKYANLTFNKDIVELNNDDMIRRTIQKMSKLNDSDIKNMLSTNKKNKNIKEFNFDTENKNSKTLQNLRDMLFNKNNTTNNNLSSTNIGNETNNILDNKNIDNNNKDVEGFFTVIKSHIEDSSNYYKNKNDKNDKIDEVVNEDNDNNDINFNFDINVNDLQEENNNFNSNIKYNIDKNDPIKNNLKTNKNKKTVFLNRGKLKYDEDIEIEMEEPEENLNTRAKKEFEKKIEKENETRLSDMQFNFNSFQFDKSVLTSFDNEKYEFLLPKFLEAGEDEKLGEESEINSIRKDDNITDSTTKLNLVNNTSNSETNEKNDLIRLNRLTTSNKKKLSLGNFESESKSLLHNLSRMTLDRNDFKGSISFIEKLKALEKKDKKDKDNLDSTTNDNRQENNEISNNFNDLDLVEQDDRNDQNEIDEDKKEKDIKYLSEDKKEEEDAVQLKEDLEKNVFNNKKNISFNKIRNKLDNSEKFVEPKLFYDLLLLAQKGDVEMTQKKLMNNESINICLKY